MSGRKAVEEVLIRTGWAAEFETREETRNIEETLELLRKGTPAEELMRMLEDRLTALNARKDADKQQAETANQ
ncbi:MAG: hypothetical protein LBL76_05790 [Treponema sp.]|jgi:hypothetical protein|nr:hypothetical protein [Treponema sp.]